jgi:hypothetical protein
LSYPGGCVYADWAAIPADAEGFSHLTKQFVLVDPFHEYATRFVDVIAQRFGYRPLCVHTGGRGEFRRGMHEYPALRGHEHLFAPPDGLQALGRDLSETRDVAGAIPFNEAVLGRTIDFLRGLGSAWNDSSVLSLLRDKFALKDRLRRMRPAVAVGRSHRAVAGAALSLDGMPDRFVLKPNGGYGNASVGFFTRDTPRAAIEHFLRQAPGTEFVVEEYHPGTEYFVNGQTDAQGATMVLAVFRYERIWANGFQVDWMTHKVPHAAPEFALLESYARFVVTSLGLRRSPFHLEVKLAGTNARLVEIGARLVGNRNAFVCADLHGGLDPFALAADHYLHDGAGPAKMPDWDCYDGRELTYVHGVSLDRSLICSLRGIDAIEGDARFAGWVKKPELGQRLRPTVDLFTAPWCFIVQGPKGTDLRPAAAELRSRLRINQDSAPLARPALHLRDVVRRAVARIERSRR